MFYECIQFQKNRLRPLMSFKEGEFITTSDEFKFPNQKAQVMVKGVIPAGFDEKHLVKIYYEEQKDFEVLDCSYKSYLVKPAE